MVAILCLFIASYSLLTCKMQNERLHSAEQAWCTVGAEERSVPFIFPFPSSTNFQTCTVPGDVTPQGSGARGWVGHFGILVLEAPSLLPSFLSPPFLPSLSLLSSFFSIHFDSVPPKCQALC